MLESSCPRYREICDLKITEAQFARVISPNLRMGIRMGFLDPDDEGWVTLDQVTNFLTKIGIKNKSLIEKLLVDTAIKAGPDPTCPDRINLIQFPGTFLDHGSDSGIINNPKGFNEDRLIFLKQFSANGKWLTEKDLNYAGKEFHRCPVNFSSLKGKYIYGLEISTLLHIYGKYVDGVGKVLMLEDIEVIWQQSRFPDHFQLPKKPYVSTWYTFKVWMKQVMYFLR